MGISRDVFTIVQKLFIIRYAINFRVSGDKNRVSNLRHIGTYYHLFPIVQVMHYQGTVDAMTSLCT